MRKTCLLLALLVGASTQFSVAGSRAAADEGAAAPTYSRMRTGAGNWGARGARPWFPRGNWGYGGYGYFPPFYSPVVAGTWYQRPYPYHFDYYRYRWGPGGASASQSDPGMGMAPAPGYPRLSTPLEAIPSQAPGGFPAAPTQPADAPAAGPA